MSRGAALTGALLTTLATPVTWPLALAVFLLRGGILLVALPIVVLPTPVGLGNVLAPTIMSIAFGSVTVGLLVVSSTIVVGVLAWLLLGGWIAAALEAEGVRVVALDAEVSEHREPAPGSMPAEDAGSGRIAARILVARLVAYIPLGLALSWGSLRFVFTAYGELTSPSDVTMPIVLRVVRASPEVVVAIVLAWMIGEIVGAMAARRIALGGDRVAAALRAALLTSLRHPLATLARFLLPTLALLVVLAPSALAAASAWAPQAPSSVSVPIRSRSSRQSSCSSSCGSSDCFWPRSCARGVRPPGRWPR